MELVSLASGWYQPKPMAQFNGFFIVAFSTLFTIVNPMGALGPFIAMTAEYDRKRRVDTAKRACFVAFGVLLGSSILGAFVFRFFGVTIPALRIAGGTLLFFVAMDMLNARPSRVKSTNEEAEEGAAKEDIAVFPLAIPLLSGPGSIVSVFILSEKATLFSHHIALYLAIAGTGLTSFLVLREANRLAGFMGQIGMNVMTRLLGLVLAAVAIQFVLDGVREALFPA